MKELEKTTKIINESKEQMIWYKEREKIFFGIEWNRHKIIVIIILDIIVILSIVAIVIGCQK